MNNEEFFKQQRIQLRNIFLSSVGQKKKKKGLWLTNEQLKQIVNIFDEIGQVLK